MTNDEFNYIDDPRTPKVIKPVTKLHDELVKGYYDGKDLQLPKLIRRIEKNLTIQVEELVNLEDQLQASVLSLVKAIELLRKLEDDRLKKGAKCGVCEVNNELTNDIQKFIDHSSSDIMERIISNYMNLKNNENEDI